MKLRSSLLLIFSFLPSLHAADELIMADGKKQECEVMMYQAGKLLVYFPGGKREIIPVSKIKEGTFEPPDELMNMVKLASGQTTKFLVRGFGEDGFDTIQSNGDEKWYTPNEILAIKFRSKTTYLAVPKAAGTNGGKPGGNPDPAPSKRITNEQIPDIGETLTMDVPSKMADGFAELMELRDEIAVLDSDLSGSKSIENKKKKAGEEIKTVENEIRGVIGKEVGKISGQIAKMKEEVIKLDEKFTAASARGKNTDEIFEEKMKVVAEQKKLQTILDAFYWNFTGFVPPARPARDSIHAKLGRPAPSSALYVFGKGHTRLDKTTLKGVNLVCFWSTQNRNSQKALKLVEHMVDKFPDGKLTVYTVNVGDKLETLKQLMPKMSRKKNLYHALDVHDAKEKTMVKNYAVMLLPTIALIDEGGKLDAAYIGYSSKWKNLFEDRLETMLNPEGDF